MGDLKLLHGHPNSPNSHLNERGGGRISLKIPERISQAQVSLKRDLGMVREFAANVERELRFPLA